ncbi:MAG: TIGR03000 domain-containing protein [Gemmataceae bacterium]|nr:TIGR03000 domain-containing protein [Gemmataceae bacterium]MCI0737582.1 TIGR03000 domain-containing protein [Gemmataceae bacterium]
MKLARRSLACLIVAGVLSAWPGNASAQVFGGGYGFGTGPINPFNPWYGAWGFGGGAGVAGMGMYPPGPAGGIMPYYPNGFSRSGPIYFMGFGAPNLAKPRTTIHPAIPVPSKEIVQAALSGDTDTRARLTVHVPKANARVWLDGTLTKQTGKTRQYVTPALKADQPYSFQVRIAWTDANGIEQSQQRTISFRAGDQRTIDLRGYE